MKKRKMLAMFLAVAMCMGLSACGSTEESSETVETTEEQEVVEEEAEAEAEAASPMVDLIDYSLDSGSIKYAGVEKASSELVEEENVIIVKFDYTNNQDAPAQCQSTFRIQFFQNGVEIDESLSYSSEAPEQYELVGNFFAEAMKGGTVRFGQLVKVKDETPITVMVSENGGTSEECQMMELDITDALNGKASEVESKPAEKEESAEKDSSMTDSINFALDDGSIKYVGVEKAEAGLVDEDNVIILKFDYTNNQDAPAQCQSTFRIQFFQNGVESTDSLSYSSSAPEQYELVGNFFAEAMKGGTVTFGQLLKLNDETPVTIMVSENGGTGEDYQMMEVDVAEFFE